MKQGLLCGYDLFIAKKGLEYEANLFVACLLMDGKEAVRCVREGCSPERHASHMDVHLNCAALI